MYDYLGATVTIGLVGLICSVFVYVIDTITDDNYVPKNKRKATANNLKTKNK